MDTLWLSGVGCTVKPATLKNPYMVKPVLKTMLKGHLI